MLETKNITKRFPGVVALENINMHIAAGKVTAVIGGNGAGKSTLMKILSGVYTDYEGQLIFKGKPANFAGTAAAQDAGIAIIHQELNLVPYLSITENIFLGRELQNRLGMLDQQAMHAKAKELLESLGLQLDPRQPVTNLKVGQQQMVEIAKALLQDADLIIMDEPTSAITTTEVENLFAVIQTLRNKNKAVVYISHKLQELFTIADHFVVIRDGKTISSGTMQDISHDALIRDMTGTAIQYIEKQNRASENQVLLQLNAISLIPKNKDIPLKDISLTVKKGEIVGIFGLMGAGRTELLETLFGLHPGNYSGHIQIEGKSLNIQQPADAIAAGIVLLPEDRKKDGLVLGMEVQQNISLPVLEKITTWGLLNRTKELSLANQYIRQLQIKTSSAKQQTKNLSGGNQQKIVLAKWLGKNPKLFLLDEPTRGIDVKAKNEIYLLMQELAANGLGILMVSSELSEILTISDRILVMAEGRITADLPVNAATEDILLKAAIATN